VPSDSPNPPIPPTTPTSPISPSDSGSPVADLKLVDESTVFEDRADTEEFHPEPQDTVTDESSPRSLPVWMFVVGLIVAVVVIGWQAQLASELEAEVAGLEGRLERSNALLEAHRSHLGKIRGGVYDLSERLDGLRALVDGGPAAGLTESAPEAQPTP
jgi:hypothetical protein